MASLMTNTFEEVRVSPASKVRPLSTRVPTVSK